MFHSQITPDGKRQNAVQQEEVKPKPPKMNEDDFFEMLSRSQSKRMDDQRCSIKVGRRAQCFEFYSLSLNHSIIIIII